ncbi:hypothetical protein E24_00176 [Faustovirus]|nr:hypothetical protein PRJ_Fausto_00162 [Faustovirus]AMN83107.1 hypothetical protein E24_00176 [Faustovirus]AMN84089.1 hypothetical protein D5a_00175 [Faustovirus]AMN85076.1 hypothetical protein E23_00175 [Faustovirus]QBR99075.1 hypothetical protein [Faustovirus mariensis]
MNSSNETIVYVGNSNSNNGNKDPFDEIDSIIPRGGVMRPVVTQPTVTTRVIKRNHGDVIVRSVGGSVESVDLDRTLQSFDRSNDLLFAFAFMLLFIGCLGIYGFIMNRLRM